MRKDYPRERTSVLFWLISAIVAAFAVHLGFSSLRVSAETTLLNEFALSVEAIKSGHIWTLFTHSFVHEARLDHLFHIVLNLFALYFVGRELLPLLGNVRFTSLYAGAVVAGALAWLAVHWRTGGNYFGATAGVEALITVYACFYPQRRWDFLIFFVFPVTLKPKHLVIGLVVFEVAGLMIQEIGRAPLPFDFAVAHSAHLGGIFAGLVYFRYFQDITWELPSRSAHSVAPRLSKGRNPGEPEQEVAAQVDLSSPSNVRAEVDRVLDKINSHGLAALTASEKRLLDDARDLLSRR